MKDDYKVISHHIFIFPFNWSILSSKYENHVGTTRRDFKNYISSLCDLKIDGEKIWEIKHPNNESEIEERIKKYNEKNYFHSFVAREFYPNTSLAGDESSLRETVSLQVKQLESRTGRGGTYSIVVKGKNYDLSLYRVELNVYSFGTGSLSLFCRNLKYSDFEEILEINQFGRRIYPPFLVTNSESYEGKETFDSYLLADRISISLPKSDSLSKEVISLTSEFNNRGDDLLCYTELPPHISELIHAFQSSNDKEIEKFLHIIPSIDDRLFVLSSYRSDKFWDDFKKNPLLKNELSWAGYTGLSSYSSIQHAKNPEVEKTKNLLYKYVFVDADFDGVANSQYASFLLNTHTYTRMMEKGILYGISKYSFTCLMDSKSPKFIDDHINSIYYKMTEVCLIQRASILAFADRISSLLNYTIDHETTEGIRTLYRDYIRFVNKIYFREVTPQEQGIELYNMLQEHMRLPEQVKELDQEIEELHRFANMLSEERRVKSLDFLAFVGVVFTLMSLFVGMLGLEDIRKYLFGSELSLVEFFSVSAVLVGFSIILGLAISRSWLRKLAQPAGILLLLFTPILNAVLQL